MIIHIQTMPMKNNCGKRHNNVLTHDHTDVVPLIGNHQDRAAVAGAPTLPAKVKGISQSHDKGKRGKGAAKAKAEATSIKKKECKNKLTDWQRELKNYHSKMWHRERNRARSEGLPDAAAKERSVPVAALSVYCFTSSDYSTRV
jgi:hypothetical protein